MDKKGVHLPAGTSVACFSAGTSRFCALKRQICVATKNPAMSRAGCCEAFSKTAGAPHSFSKHGGSPQQLRSNGPILRQPFSFCHEALLE